MRVFRALIYGLVILLLNETEKSAGHAGGGIGHGNHGAIAGDVCQGLPAWAGERIGVAHSVRLAEFALNRDYEVAIHGGWCKEDWRGTNPKAALNGKARAARHGGERLGDGAGQLKTAARAGRRAAARDNVAGDCEPRAALGKSYFRKTDEQEQKKNFHWWLQFISA